MREREREKKEREQRKREEEERKKKKEEERKRGESYSWTFQPVTWKEWCTAWICIIMCSLIMGRLVHMMGKICPFMNGEPTMSPKRAHHRRRLNTDHSG